MIKVTCHKGMVNIDSDNIAYSNIKNMYKNSNSIADKLYRLEELLNEQNTTT